MGNTITLKGFVSLYDNTMNSLKMGELSKKITNSDGNYVMSNVNNQYYHFLYH